MSETDLGEVWARSLDELSDLHIEPHQRAWLRLTRPLGLVENTALIATPNEFVKEQLETRLRALTPHALSRELGGSTQLAVTVAPAAPAPSAPPPAAAAMPPDAGPVPPAGGHPAGAAQPGQPDGSVIIPMPREADQRTLGGHPGYLAPDGQEGQPGEIGGQPSGAGPALGDGVIPGTGPMPGD